MGQICFIAGHGTGKTGGYDPGATNGSWHEHKIVKEVAKYAQAHYNNTYAEQADLMNYDGSLYLTDRIKKVNAAKYNFVAEIHLNAQAGGTDANGTECYYAHGSSKGKKYADKICDYIAEYLGVKQRPNGTDSDGGDKIKLGSSGNDYFGIIRQTKCEAVLVETVFISNTSDLSKLKSPEGQKLCGEAIADAVAEVRGLKKVVGANSASTTTDKPSTTSKEMYRVRKSWSNANSQVGAYTKLNNAINACKKLSGYKVYNSSGKQVYPEKVTDYAAYDGKSTAIDTVFKAIGVPSQYIGNYKSRKPVAKANGISVYVGSSKQNLTLVKLAKNGKLKKV